MAFPQLRLTLVTLSVAALLGACAVAPSGKAPSSSPSSSSPAPVAAPPTPVAPAALALAGTEWSAFSIDGKAEVANPKPKLRWVSADKVSGTGGCNGFVGPAASGASGTLTLGPLASTGRACLSMPGSQEDLFFKALELTRKARIERDQLVLTDDNGKQLARFVRTN
jgi:heat shock protein HslJ